MYQCSVCGARILRSKPMEPTESCPRCGRRGQLRLFGQERGGRPLWLRRMLAAIEGGEGPVRWS